MFACQPVGVEMLDSAPIRLSVAVGVARPPGEVFAAFANDPANWGEFFPGFDTTGRYLGSGPPGLNSHCTKRLIGIVVRQTVLAWDEGQRFTLRADCIAVPIVHALVEDYRFQSDGRDGTVLRVAIFIEPRLALRPARPILPRALSIVLNTAARNLENGRWFSAPDGVDATAERERRRV